MKSQFLRLLLAAALSAGAFVGAAGAADAPSPAEKSEPAAAEKSQPAAPEAAPAGDAAAAPAAGGAPMKPIDRVNSTEKGTLKNPFSSTDKAITDEGHKIYMGLSCNGCHGGGGGGGMCPPLTNETWVYGGDDDTLFRLITLGSQEFKKKYSVERKGQETVVGPMPPFAEIMDDEIKLWKAIAWIRTVWSGRAEKKVWQ
ncbi:c-type cytochrome [Hyphomicrobium sp.]|uniref:c-type cytochrome n=1 Tax=Hyphomicrobium sp. TaxID=82 RepID=UPI003F7127F3